MSNGEVTDMEVPGRSSSEDEPHETSLSGGESLMGMMILHLVLIVYEAHRSKVWLYLLWPLEAKDLDSYIFDRVVCPFL